MCMIAVLQDETVWPMIVVWATMSIISALDPGPLGNRVNHRNP